MPTCRGVVVRLGHVCSHHGIRQLGFWVQGGVLPVEQVKPELDLGQTRTRLGALLAMALTAVVGSVHAGPRDLNTASCTTLMSWC